MLQLSAVKPSGCNKCLSSALNISVPPKLIRPSPPIFKSPSKSIIVSLWRTNWELAPAVNVILPLVVILPLASKSFIFKSPSVTIILPVESAVAVAVVPNTNLPPLSSQIIAALAPLVPLSIIIPESFKFVPVNPLFNPIILSVISKLVVFIVVVVPLIVKLPVIATLPLAVISVAAISPLTSNSTPAAAVLPIPTSPVELTLNLSTPAVSTVNILLPGNLIAVSVSPLWIILSFTLRSPPTVALEPTLKEPSTTTVPLVPFIDNLRVGVLPVAISKFFSFATCRYAALDWELAYIPSPPLPTNPIFISSIAAVFEVLTSCFIFRTWPPRSLPELCESLLFVSRATIKAISSTEVNRPEPTTLNASFGAPTPELVWPPTTCSADTGLLWLIPTLPMGTPSVFLITIKLFGIVSKSLNRCSLASYVIGCAVACVLPLIIPVVLIFPATSIPVEWILSILLS